MKKLKVEVHLSRKMSLLNATMIGFGAMIGAGIFVLTGIATGVAGPALILTLALNGCVALLTAMSYAELGSCFHDAGGGYLWVFPVSVNGTLVCPPRRVTLTASLHETLLAEVLLLGCLSLFEPR